MNARVSSNLDHALRYAARGWHVFPGLIYRRQKMSYVSAARSNGRQWGNTTDPTLICEYYSRIPEALVGIACGKDSRIWIVETDTKEGGHAANGAEALAALEAEYGTLPPTLQAKSPSGSIHRYFNWPEGVEIRNSAGVIAPGVDVRAEGGMVIAPPSIRADGAYEWVNNLPAADAPQWLINLAVNAKAPKTNAPDLTLLETIELPLNATNRAEQVLNDQFVRVAAAPSGTRNDVLNKAAWIVGKYYRELPEKLAFDTLLAACHAFGATDDAHCLGTIKSGWNAGKKEPALTMDEMFPPEVIAKAMASGAPSIVPAAPNSATSGGIPMLGGQITVAELGAPILQRFLDMAGKTAPSFESQFPQDHPLAESLGFALGAIMSKGRPENAELDVLAVLAAAHPPSFNIVRERLGLQDSGNLSAAVSRFNGKVDYELRTKGGFVPAGRDGKPDPALPANLHRLLRIIGCELRRNEWLERDEIRGGDEWSNWTYIDDAVLAQLLTEARNRGFQPTDKFMWQTLSTFGRGNRVDPARDRLTALENAWDGTPRLDTWLGKVFGVPADAYHRVVGRRVVGGMVRRVREPGCKVDEMAVLIGEQGVSKSKACRMLSPVEGGFTDGVKLGEESKELILLLAGRAVVEVAEMGKRSAAGIDAIKAMLGKTHDTGRTAYAHSVSERARRNIFIGTSNDDTPLIDITGNRRFLPVRCERVDLEWLAANIEQLIGEACALQTQGETFDLPQDTWEIAHTHQEAARERASFELLLEHWFVEEDLAHKAMARPSEFITANDLAALLGRNLRSTVPPSSVSAVMKRLQFKPDTRKINRKAARIWLRGEWRVNGEGMQQHREWPPNSGNHHVVYLPRKDVPPPPG